jgi:hypothetical protein
MPLISFSVSRYRLPIRFGFTGPLEQIAFIVAGF